nr:Alkyl hydroperoxide reductase subunit C [Candidatus Pantoea persica]
MLDTNLKTQLKAYLEKLTKPVELISTLDDGAKVSGDPRFTGGCRKPV